MPFILGFWVNRKQGNNAGQYLIHPFNPHMYKARDGGPYNSSTSIPNSYSYSTPAHQLILDTDTPTLTMCEIHVSTSRYRRCTSRCDFQNPVATFQPCERPGPECSRPTRVVTLTHTDEDWCINHDGMDPARRKREIKEDKEWLAAGGKSCVVM